MKDRNRTRLITGFLLALLLASRWLVAPATSAQAPDEPVVRVVLFYSETCFHCHQVITQVLIPLQEEYGDQLQIVGIEISQPGGSQLFQAAIAHYEVPPERRGVPFLIVGERVLVGSGEIPADFPAMVETALAGEGIDWPDFPGMAQILAALETPPAPTPTLPATETPTATARPTLPPTATMAATRLPSPTPETTPVAALEVTTPASVRSSEPVYLAYFFDPTCLECARVSAELEDLQAAYPNLVLRKYDVRQEAALNEAMCDKYQVPDKYHLATPMIFIGPAYLTPDGITRTRLKTLIEDPVTAQTPAPWAAINVDETAATARIVERFKQFGLLAVIGAGLLDGVNPCAFTTLIFFVSYLTLVGRTGREILLVGMAFTLAVFLTYLAMGLGLAEVVRQIQSITLIGQIIYGITALVCLVLAVFSLLDYLKIRRQQLADISLQLPKFLKRRIHDTIRSHSRMNGYLGAAFVAGILVSVFELACTGQVYLPTIVFVASVTELRWMALAYLVLYNLMFVMPLLVVFIVTYFGTSSRRLTDLFQRHAGAVKLLTAILFAILGLWLGYLVLAV